MQSNRVPFGSSPEEGQEPEQATNRGRRQSPTPLNDPPITEPPRGRQTPRVISSQPAQSFHLVPQDDATQCNECTRGSPISLKWWNQVCKWVDCVAQLPKGVHKCMRCQESGQGWPHPLFIATQANRAISPLELQSARSTDRAVPGTEKGRDLPNSRIPTGHRTRHGSGTALGVAVTIPAKSLENQVSG
jgi:hypothetical protein